MWAFLVPMTIAPPTPVASRAFNDKIEKRHFDLGLIDQGRPEIVGESDFQLYPAADRARQHFGHAAHRGIEIDWLRSEVLAARERQQLLCKLRPTLRRARCRMHHFAQHLVGPEPHFDKFKIAQDGGEQIVEIVCETAGQLAQGLHFGRTVKGVLYRLALLLLLRHLFDRVGDVAGHLTRQRKEAGDLLQDGDIGGVELAILIMGDDPDCPDRPVAGITERYDQPFHDWGRCLAEIVKQARRA
jgi:hypothetical protein